MPAHKHAALMKLYWQDAEETETPWERWEYNQGGEGPWNDCVTHPFWGYSDHYQRKPRTININGHEVPEPVREPLDKGTRYWTPTLNSEGLTSNLDDGWKWAGDLSDRRELERGLVHLTREAAEAHARALLSFT